MTQRGLSKAQLARELGVSNAHVANWLNGQLPRADQLLLIATHFGVSMEYILTGTGQQQSQRIATPSESGTIKAAKTEAERLARLLGEAEHSLSKLRSFLG